jgi:hypothetical protein
MDKSALKPPQPVYAFELRFRPPTFREEAEALVYIEANKKPPPNMIIVGGWPMVVENAAGLLMVVRGAYEQRPTPGPIQGILEANSMKDPPEDFEVIADSSEVDDETCKT